MQFEVGKIYDGLVKGITTYGAFVELDKNTTGMVHISEIANSYVNDIKEHLTENQPVKVKIIGVNEAGKIGLSIKKAVDPDAEGSADNNSSGSGNSNSRGGNNSAGGNSNYRGGNNSGGGNSNYRSGNNNAGGSGNFGGGNRRPRPNVWEPKKQAPVTELTFEDMLNKFKQNSEEKMGELKRNIDSKRKGSSRRGK